MEDKKVEELEAFERSCFHLAFVYLFQFVKIVLVSLLLSWIIILSNFEFLSRNR